MWVQLLRWALSGRERTYGVPPPEHVSVCPSLVSKRTETMDAVTSTLVGPSVRLARCWSLGSTHSQVARLTTWSREASGFILISGGGSDSAEAARDATTAGSTVVVVVDDVVVVDV